MFTAGILLTIFIFIVGLPIWMAFSLGGLFLIYFWQGQQLTVFPQIFFAGMESYSLMALPFFLLSGQLMVTGGASKAIFNWIESFVGHYTGGLAVAGVLACMLFGTISGSTVATILAIGSMAVPIMLEKGYDRNYTLGLFAAAGSLGNLIPPSIHCILYASLTGAPIEILFFAGIFPGIVLTVMLSVMAVIIFKWKGTPVLPRGTWRERRRTTIKALPALMIPIFILGGIYSGMMTPVEAAAASVFITIPVAVIYKSFNWKNMLDAMMKAMSTTCMVYFILGGTAVFVNILTFAQIPQKLINIVTTYNLSQSQLLAAMLVVLSGLDVFMEPVPMLFLVVPITAKAIFTSGIHWITFNFLLLQFSAVMFCTPPLAMALFAVAQMFKVRIEDVTKGVWPFLAVLVVHLVLFTFFPELLLWLPRLVFGDRVDIPVIY